MPSVCYLASFGIELVFCFLILIANFPSLDWHNGVLGQHTVNQTWNKILVFSFLLLAWLVVIIQLFMGADILRWRSFYSTHDTAWKAHYREVFDHGIREALCCLGRAKYLYGPFHNFSSFALTFLISYIRFFVYPGVFWKKMRFTLLQGC